MTSGLGRFGAFVLGLFTIASQSALLREYLVLFRGSELAFGLFFSAWFFFVALGAFIVKRFDRVFRFVAENAFSLVALYPIGGLLGLTLLPLARSLSGIAPFEPTPPLALLVGAVVASAPVSLVTGLAFPGLCLIAAEETQKGAVVAYVVEAVGAVLGGLLATSAFALGADSHLTVSLGGILAAVVGLIGALKRPSRQRFFVFGLSLVSSLLFLVPWTRFEMAEIRLRGTLSKGILLEERYSPYGPVTVAKMQSQTVLLSSGKVAASFPLGPETKGIAALLSTLPDGHKHAVVLGEGGLGLAASLSSYFERTTCVVLDVVYGKTFVEEAQKANSELPRNLEITFADPRDFLRSAPSSSADLIVVATGEPESLFANRLYTVEAFKDAGNVLKKSGVIAVPVRSAENYIGTEFLRYGQSVFRTLSSVFGSVSVVPGEEAIFVASEEASRLVLDASELIKRYKGFAPSPPPFPPEGFVSLLPPDRVKLAQSLYNEGGAPGDLLNSDRKPLALFLNLLTALRESSSPLLGPLWFLHEAGWWVLYFLAGLFLVVALRHRVRLGPSGDGFGRGLFLGVAGGVSISVYVCLLASFQAMVGAAYREVGGASAIFMAGLAFGSLAGGRLIRVVSGIRAALTFLGLLALALLLAPEGVRALEGSGEEEIRIGLFALLFGGGAFTGLAWPIAASLSQSEKVGAELETSDHLGAFLFSLVAGVFAMALYGIEGVFQFLALTVGATGICILADEGLRRWHWFFSTGLGRALSFRSSPFIVAPAILSFIGAASIVIWHASRGEDPSVQIRLSPEQLRELETFEREEFEAVPVPHHRLEGLQDGKGSAVVATTFGVVGHVRGWGGPMNLAVSVGGDGTIRKVRVLSHKETPSYVRGLPKFLAAMEGQNATKALVVTDREALDAMTGATVTKVAVLQAVDKAREVLARQVLGLSTEGLVASPPWWEPFKSFRVLWVLGSLLGAVVVHFFGGFRVRVFYLILVLAVGGIGLNMELSAVWLLGLFRLEWPSWTSNGPMWLMTALVLAFSLLFGPIYCAHGCPFGALQEMASRLSGRVGLLTRPRRQWVVAAKGVKYVVLLLVVLSLFRRDPEGALSFDPLQAAFSGRVEGVGFFVALLAVLGSLFVFRFWCRFFCPVGAFLNLFNRIAGLLRLNPSRRYGRCDLDVLGQHDLECLQCNRCVRESLGHLEGPSAR